MTNHHRVPHCAVSSVLLLL